MKPLDSTGAKRLHRSWRRRTSGGLGLILDDVQGPFNVGAILRTAAALRAEHLWLTARTPDADDPKVAKTALGTQRFLHLERAASAVDAIASARQLGYRVVAVELAEGAAPLHEVDLGASVALVVGHEDRGCDPATLDAADAVAYVPLLGRVGSLNVATAAAMACYEVRRREWTTVDT